jgi:uncharacterized membrane protein YkvA (DUF1232 family)
VLPGAGTLGAAWRFFADSAVPLPQKAVFALAVLYVMVPVDALPDLLPLLGWLDDVGVAALALAYLLRTIRPYRRDHSVEAVAQAAGIETPGVQIP